MMHFYETVFGYAFVRIVMHSLIHGLKWRAEIGHLGEHDCGPNRTNAITGYKQLQLVMSIV